MRVYYFGCVRTSGHYMHAPFGHYDSYATPFTRTNPWGTKIDGGLCPAESSGAEGVALVHHKDGWTALSFWDRSVDSRPGSNSNFLAEGTHDFASMLQIAGDNFPGVLERIKFPIVESEPATEQKT